MSLKFGWYLDAGFLLPHPVRRLPPIPRPKPTPPMGRLTLPPIPRPKAKPSVPRLTLPPIPRPKTKPTPRLTLPPIPRPNPTPKPRAPTRYNTPLSKKASPFVPQRHRDAVRVISETWQAFRQRKQHQKQKYRRAVKVISNTWLNFQKRRARQQDAVKVISNTWLNFRKRRTNTWQKFQDLKQRSAARVLERFFLNCVRPRRIRHKTEAVRKIIHFIRKYWEHQRAKKLEKIATKMFKKKTAKNIEDKNCLFVSVSSGGNNTPI